MYCVKCGVSLEEGIKTCPLCGTPVWAPEPKPRTYHYNPDLYPVKENKTRITSLFMITLILAAVPLGCLIACLNHYGHGAWSAYVVASFILLYVVAVLPAWFPRYYPAIFIPVSFVAVAGFLLFICLYTGGRWFLSFALPVTGLVFLFVYGAFWLTRLGLMPRIKLRLMGIYFFLLGGATLLLEFFMHISFDLPMFNWSLYTAGFFGAFGLFLFVASFIKPLRRAMYKKMFV